ncbi:MAG: hypothetical protein BIFFINMI_00003 [Phycisphaerae bacterium]|nr:hypothetical protein [Phycisphaerae bacterium]
MTTRYVRWLGTIAFCLAVAPAAWGEIGFSDAPTVTRADGGWTVAFAASAPTDVELAVLDKDGKVVRHLAAGVLGGDKVAAPLQPGLAQKIAWDGADDAGVKVDPAGLLVRVRLGMGVKFGRIIGSSPYTGEITTGAPSDSVAIDGEGNLYVKMGSFVHQLHEHIPWQLVKFDRNGKYVRTLLPYPPSTDPAKAAAFRLIDTGDGHLTPASLDPMDPVLFSLGDDLCRRLVDGRLVFVSDGVLNFLPTDGAGPIRSMPMRTRPDKLKWAKWLSPQVAFSPDGKYAYYSNVANTPYDGKQPSDIDPKFPQGRVYRHDLTGEKTDPEPFFDLKLPDWETAKYWMPSAWDKKTAAAGIDVDAKGNVLVCDLVNQQVVEVSPEGKQLSATPAPWPDKVLVNRKTGALYVVSRKVSRGALPPATLLKIEGRGESAKVVVQLPLNGQVGQTLALDDSGDTPMLWLGGGTQLVPIQDRGEELVVGRSILNPDRDALTFLCYSDVDPQADLVYVTHSMGPAWRYDGATGAGGLAPIKAVDLAVGPGGMIYTWGTGGWHGPITRYSRDFKPAPLPSGKNSYGELSGRYGRGNSVAGMDVDPHGRVFASNGGNSCQVVAFDAQGQPITFKQPSQSGPGSTTLIGGMVDQSGSIRVDPAGNVYVLQIGLPKDFKRPAGFERDPAYNRASGTIYKFGPGGGQFVKGVPEGSLAAYAACGPISGNWNSTQSVCHCTKPRFDVDGYGRLYIPNAFSFSVKVVDNAGNEMVTFGHYGNYDAAGPESAEPKPDIPLGWPITAGASDRFIYVGDCLNHRVVRVDRTYAVEKSCPVN